MTRGILSSGMGDFLHPWIQKPETLTVFSKV
jgi:hypothetical protein